MNFAFAANEFSAIYIALEEPVEHIMQKYEGIEPWQKRMMPMHFLDDIDEATSPDDAGRALNKFFTKPEGCPSVRILQTLSPVQTIGICPKTKGAGRRDKPGYCSPFVAEEYRRKPERGG